MIRVGTSGWNYDHWQGPFYPQDKTQDEWLAYYSQRFNTVEINNSFYNLPDEDSIQNWRGTVKGDFVFSIKASRYLTHMKKLKEAPESRDQFLSRADLLQDRRGPILFQLPPNWNANPDRLEQFVEGLGGSRRYVFEFRDTSWFTPEIYDVLRNARCAFCIYELGDTTSPDIVTADFAYIRLHGPGSAYEGSYDDGTLKDWAQRIREWDEDGLDVYCYFDNDQNGYAPANARTLSDFLD
jgi:uncharacterized protein YecE (DUF72 family)